MPNGIIIIDKDSDWTSMDVCAKLRGVFHERRIGHAGTLDPMATGVLPVFIGQATKAISFTEHHDKEYLATLRLGLTTDTQDSSGRVLTRSEDVRVSEAALSTVLERFRGDILQIPPMYAAIKVNGQKLYTLARAGKEVTRPPRPVHIEALELLERSAPQEFLLRIVCSKGTYVRTLCHDIGQALGCGGVMSALRRTRVGAFTLDEAHRIGEVSGETPLMALDTLFAEPPLTLESAEQERRLRCGGSLRVSAAEGAYRVYGMDGSFLALARVSGGVLQSVKNFFTAAAPQGGKSHADRSN